MYAALSPLPIQRALIACLVAIALLAAGLLASAPTASAAGKTKSERRAQREVTAKVRRQFHVIQVGTTCKDNHGWFGCNFMISYGNRYTVGNAIVRYRRGHARIKVFAVQCVGSGCKKG